MANNFGGGYFSFMDFDREMSSMGFNTGAITAVSLPGTLTAFGELKTAIDAVTLGTIAEEGLYVNRTRLSNVPPSDANAQRERKWLVTYEDATPFFDDPVNAIPNAGYKKVFNVEIPTAKTVGQLLANSDEADMTTPEMIALKAKFAALVKSPYGGAVTVTRITVVGRNN